MQKSFGRWIVRRIVRRAGHDGRRDGKLPREVQQMIATSLFIDAITRSDAFEDVDGMELIVLAQPGSKMLACASICGTVAGGGNSENANFAFAIDGVRIGGATTIKVENSDNDGAESASLATAFDAPPQVPFRLSLQWRVNNAEPSGGGVYINAASEADRHHCTISVTSL